MQGVKNIVYVPTRQALCPSNPIVWPRRGQSIAVCLFLRNFANEAPKTGGLATDIMDDSYKNMTLPLDEGTDPQQEAAPAVDYTDENIRHLDDMEHIRVRSGMYIGRLGDGSQSDDGIYVLLKEVMDNSIEQPARQCTRLRAGHPPGQTHRGSEQAEHRRQI